MNDPPPPRPRWAPLPDDPPDLRRWLAEQAHDEVPDDWPQEAAP